MQKRSLFAGLGFGMASSEAHHAECGELHARTVLHVARDQAQRSCPAQEQRLLLPAIHVLFLSCACATPRQLSLSFLLFTAQS